MAPSLTCTPFIVSGDLPSFCANIPQATKDAAIDAATDLVVQMTQGLVIGRCPVTVRPIADNCYPGPCGELDAIPLQGFNPQVTHVKIDGAILPAENYTITDGTQLVRTQVDANGRPMRWPRRNRLHLALTQPDTFGVTYTRGRAVDAVVKKATVEVVVDMLTNPDSVLSDVSSASMDGLNIANYPGAEKQPFEWLSRLIAGVRSGQSMSVWTPEMRNGWDLVTLRSDQV